MIKDSEDPMRTIALKVIDQAYRDVVALEGKHSVRQFQPGVETSKKRLQEEKDRLTDWLLTVSPMPYSLSWWGAIAGMSEERIEKSREELLEALDKVKDFV